MKEPQLCVLRLFSTAPEYVLGMSRLHSVLKHADTVEPRRRIHA
jgi:hypothetical protein